MNNLPARVVEQVLKGLEDKQEWLWLTFGTSLPV